MARHLQLPRCEPAKDRAGVTDKVRHEGLVCYSHSSRRGKRIIAELGWEEWLTYKCAMGFHGVSHSREEQ
jgi:hypothetical protein